MQLNLSLFLVGLLLLTTACAAPALPSTPEPDAGVTIVPTTVVPTVVAPTATPTPELSHGYIQTRPFLNADAGNFQLEPGATVTFTWMEAPVGAERYEFVLRPQDKSPAFVIGVDSDPSDGVSLQWVVPFGIAADLTGFAYFPDGRILEVEFSGAVYSAPAP